MVSANKSIKKEGRKERQRKKEKKKKKDTLSPVNPQTRKASACAFLPHTRSHGLPRALWLSSGPAPKLSPEQNPYSGWMFKPLDKLPQASHHHFSELIVCRLLHTPDQDSLWIVFLVSPHMHQGNLRLPCVSILFLVWVPSWFITVLLPFTLCFGDRKLVLVASH